eukprot:gene52-6774_t
MVVTLRRLLGRLPPTCAVHQLRLTARAVDAGFQAAVREVVGPHGGAHHAAAPKGDARMRNKAMAMADHRQEVRRPRPARNVDVVRCCVCFDAAAGLRAAAAALCSRFEGAVR